MPQTPQCFHEINAVGTRQDMQMKEKKSTWWDRRSLEDVKQSWDIGDWTAANQVAYLLGRLAQSRAICVNGKYRDANNIPTKFVEILWCN